MTLLLDRDVRERVPLIADQGGVVRISGTRVPLEVIVDAFNQGDSAEEIAAAYSSLPLPDVYAILTYYLRHRDAVDQYVKARRQEADALRERLKAEFGTQGIRERLLARRVASPVGSC
jgi:uncharacterized protein (DUF433 family)